jgi:TM2 domain-containing membrane protein YozV
MSSGISQIGYWQEARRPYNKNNNDTSNTYASDNTTSQLSYNVFLALSVLGGFFALDHLYLRSPLTFLAKIIVNIVFLGAWWLYDASHAIFNRDVVKAFGLGVPGLGPKGIGAGVLAGDKPDKKHLSFLFYGLAVIFGGLFGLDSFIVGDKTSGIIRIICLISAIFAPVAIFWWLYNLFKFIFKTKDVTNQYWDYFGAPAPAEYSMSFGEKLVYKVPFLQTLLSPFLSQPLNTYLSQPVKVLIQEAIAPFDAVIQPITATAQSALNTGKAAAQAVSNTAEAATTIAGTIRNVAGESLEGLKAVADAAGVLSEVGNLPGSITADALRPQQVQQQQGGSLSLSNSPILSYTFLATFVGICVSGFYLTLKRLKKDEPKRKQTDDAPPEPNQF